jgi:hypothetical protein
MWKVNGIFTQFSKLFVRLKLLEFPFNILCHYNSHNCCKLSFNCKRNYYSLRSTVEEIEISKFDSNPLAGLSNELICARHIFWIGTWISWWNKETCTFLCKVYNIGTRRANHGLSNIEFRCWINQFQLIF